MDDRFRHAVLVDAVADHLHRLLDGLVSQFLLELAFEGQAKAPSAQGRKGVAAERLVGHSPDGDPQVGVVPLHENRVEVRVVAVKLGEGNVLGLEPFFHGTDVGLHPVVHRYVRVHEEHEVDAAPKVQALLEPVLEVEEDAEHRYRKDQQNPPLNIVAKHRSPYSF